MPFSVNSVEPSSSKESLDNEAKVHQEVIARKRKMASAKVQAWKETYYPQPEDIPKSNCPHDKPWRDYWGNFNWDDEEYDTENNSNGGQS